MLNHPCDGMMVTNHRILQFMTFVDSLLSSPGVPLRELGGRKTSIAGCDGGRETRAGHGEQELEAHEAASDHGQLSHLHHSAEHRRHSRGREGGETWRGRHTPTTPAGRPGPDSLHGGNRN